ncbi:MAG TPA: zf-HC2 domain-containing protein [Bryobacteraceae bacterium]|nr:zf-HC2 domain-containing protein [Bryobacteraceae bacterium]HOQ44980.1 zf-HC2 domain-containing protein [Bryobacteraceae bacterium]HPQ14621.1 zf-HC2 domain-containing protein [Bryobacteraceae bacterium]HPU72010.1 zf-HC2 domain-containing protein [Bryobacteraceae bacterium]
MNHREAVERQAADKYLLNELSPAERSAFEEHYFECPECAAEVEAGAAFAANARAVLAEGGDYAGRRTATGWLRPAYLITAAAALAAIAGYQELVRIPRLRKELQRLGEPRAYVAHFLRPVGQGGDQVLAVPKEALFVGLLLDIPPGAECSAYVCDIRAEAPESGGFSVAAPAPASPAAHISILIPVSRLQSGAYTLVLRCSGDLSETARFGFKIQLD